MPTTRRPRFTATAPLLLWFPLVASGAWACGSSSVTGDAVATDGGSTTPPPGADATTSTDAGDDASSSSPGSDASSDQMAGSDSGASDASGGGTIDAGSPCTPATLERDCPILACMTASSCVQNVCQYTAQTPCSPFTIGAAFASGEVDLTVANVTVHGNISEFRPDDGVVCVGTTCLTGGITP